MMSGFLSSLPSQSPTVSEARTVTVSFIAGHGREACDLRPCVRGVDPPTTCLPVIHPKQISIYIVTKGRGSPTAGAATSDRKGAGLGVVTATARIETDVSPCPGPDGVIVGSDSSNSLRVAAPGLYVSTAHVVDLDAATTVSDVDPASNRVHSQPLQAAAAIDVDRIVDCSSVGHTVDIRVTAYPVLLVLCTPDSVCNRIIVNAVKSGARLGP